MGIVNRKYLFALVIIVFFLISRKGYAQNVDLENFYKPNFKVTGGINANAIFYNSNGNNSRDPFTYLLSGNLNVSAFMFSMPVSYSITNQGNNLGYTNPFNFNRLCLMPKYKWVKAYIGDVSMSFSPYTLNGSPFRGFGLELTPSGPLKVSLMGGQLLKKVTASEGLDNIPVYQRMGYGVKIGYDTQKYKMGWIGFYAKDIYGNETLSYDEKGVVPMENWVNSFSLNTSVIKNLDFNIEYALSVLTADSRANPVSGGSLRNKLFSAKESTSFQKAINTSFTYSIQKSKLGLVYERIDPNYRTLGSLYFSNDLENIALTFSRPFYKDNITVAASLGYQRDDLASQKKQNTKRIVGSMNLNYRINDRINFSGTYSNFSTYTNKSLNQFDLINNPNVVPADTLNYRQLSQNATANLTYAFGKKKNQNLNFNYNISGQANEQAGVIRRGQASSIQNYNLAHSIHFMEMKIAVNSSLNYTNTEVAQNNNSSAGVSVGASKKLFKDKLNTNFGLLYNTSQGNKNSSAVFGVKLNNSYVIEKHSLNLSIISMFRNSSNSKKFNDLTAMLNYSYSIDKIKLPSKKEPEKAKETVAEPVLKINYKDKRYEGTRDEIIKQLQELQLALRPIPKEDSGELEHLLTLVALTPDDKSFKEKALQYLSTYDYYDTLLNRYNEYIYETVKSLEKEMIKKDEVFEIDCTEAFGNVNKHKLNGVEVKSITNKTSYKSYLKLVQRKDEKLRRLLVHRRMLNEISLLVKTAKDEFYQNENLSNFNKLEMDYFFKKMKDKKTDKEVVEEIKVILIPYYHNLAVKNSKDDEAEFKYLINNKRSAKDGTL
jgi:hypothetical protein